VRDPTFEPHPRPRPRRWPIVLPLALVVVLAAGWAGFWYYAAGRAQAEFAAWRSREAARGRVFTCDGEEFSGFPFRFELSCAAPTLREPRITFKSADLHAAAQVYQPNLAIAEFRGPLTIVEDGGAGGTVDWTLAQASLSGLVSGSRRLALVLDKPAVTPLGGAERLATAAHLELHAREAPRLPQDPPALHVALNLSQALLSGIPRVPNTPLDADVSATVRNFTDFSPKPWRQMLRDFQAADGRLEIKQARVRQGNILASGQGSLSLTERGTLDGQINLTIAGLEQLMSVLGIDKAVGQASQNAIDRLVPGLNLGKLFGPRGNASLAAAGAAMLGQQAELEGRQAVTLPLRFADGAVFLGPLKVGEMGPVF
jgi:hypothetical protein